ncbi:DUF3868 domain-containing protein [Parabacteroides sp. AF48-14]|uniref:DUF3868 domain-containing protein n=1 Tax=Parabacteroides sp. AF48-14 TaxID=2292052 RepID=UPI000F00F8F7|nr:DUF3868 domain-containing protein [Parabacteroides sp. AF48-14]RHO72194.1 DUF3868 domain-containing protein [Parabacteroides sp. AF48-14]
MKINKSLLITTSLLAATALQAQEIKVKDRNVEQSGGTLLVGMTLDFSEVEVPAGRSVVCTPVVASGDSIRPLPPILLNGRDRQILYERTGRTFATHGEYALRRTNGHEQTFGYTARTPMAPWMKRAEIALITDECGCGWETLQNDRSTLFPINFIEPIVLKPVPAFLAPAAEEVKRRTLNGQAYLDFPINRTEIYPDYRKNPSELAAIRQTIDAVKDNNYATITRLAIKGFASPEGTYANNRRLAEGRAQALLNYVMGLYKFSNQTTYDVTSEPEDWEGLEARLETSSLNGKAEALAIVRADEPADFDAREAKLKQLPAYKQILAEIYPALRRSDYVVEYNIRNFTVEEARELIHRDPSQLSLEEMHRVALSYPAGSDEFKEVFEIAVRMYPDDPVSNLNAANIALQNKQPDRARRYLAKATPSAHKELAEAILLMLGEQWTEAEKTLTRLTDNPEVADAATANLEQVKQMIEYTLLTSKK